MKTVDEKIDELVKEILELPVVSPKPFDELTGEERRDLQKKLKLYQDLGYLVFLSRKNVIAFKGEELKLG